MYRKRTNPGREFDDADVCSSGYAVASFLSRHGLGVKSENSAVAAAYARHGEARSVVLKRFFEAVAAALKTIDFAPRHAPRTKIAFQCFQNVFQRIRLSLIVIETAA